MLVTINDLLKVLNLHFLTYFFLLYISEDNFSFKKIHIILN
jgi:hypothetical protein